MLVRIAKRVNPDQICVFSVCQGLVPKFLNIYHTTTACSCYDLVIFSNWFHDKRPRSVFNVGPHCSSSLTLVFDNYHRWVIILTKRPIGRVIQTRALNFFVASDASIDRETIPVRNSSWGKRILQGIIVCLRPALLGDM